jgi:hypothetical protein
LNGKCQSFVRDLNFWPALHTPQQFSPIAHNTDRLLCAFWTAGFTTRPPDIGSGRCILIFQVSNRTIGCILKRSARLYGGCMEPDHMEKYSLSMLTYLTEDPILKNNFLCGNPLTVLSVFLDASRHFAFTHVVCFSKKININETIGGKFCWALTWATIVHDKVPVLCPWINSLHDHRDEPGEQRAGPCQYRPSCCRHQHYC